MNAEQQPHLPPPPPSLLTTELYGSGTPPATNSAELLQSSIATTYVTINMMAPPPLSHATTTTSMPLAMTSAPLPSTTTTSTFKSSLLPMPSLEDIEGGMPSAGGAPQQQQQQQPIPGGILKYPTTTGTIPLSLPIDMGPGPPPMSMYMPQPPPPQLGGDTGAGLPPNATAASNQHPPPQPPPPAPTSLAGSSGSEATLLLSTPPPQSMPLPMPLPMSMPQATMGSTVVPMSSHTINSSSAAAVPNSMQTNLASGRTPAHSSTAGQNKAAAAAAATATTTKCCGCFGAGRRNDTNSSASAEAAANKLNKKRKHKRQTMCSALLTNLGICALLLAYTLLGSFIFLTIESEDTSALLLQQHHQRTLASTKRAGMLGRSKAAHSAHPSNINHNSNNMNNMYQQQQQHQGAYHHPENGTIAAAMASATGFAMAGNQAAAAAEVPHSVVNNDFDYGGYGLGVGGNDDNDDDEATSQAELALSADTYDVRQQTIENIWDITVSLNILYKENWTKLAALEIAKFQDQLIKRLNEDALLQLSHAMDLHGDGDADGGHHHMQSGGAGGAGGNSPATEAVLLHAYGHHGSMDWDFAKAFLYSLTVLTTIGYGNIAPRTTLGRLVTLVYALFGIPLTLVYLSSTGGILAKIAREVFSKALCCCLCSNCGYCCYDEKRMAERERRLKRKRQQEELRKQQASLQEPYYVRSPTGALESASSAFHTPEKHGSPVGQLPGPPPPDIDSLSASESRGSMHGLSILAPILLCLCMMVIYIGFGAVVLYRLENWPLLDGVYFCFMSLSTIGFGDMVPGLRRESNTTTWFCSIYIMSGMALTAMCFNVIHEEIVHRIKIVVEFKKSPVLDMAEAAPEPAFYAAGP